MVIRPISSSNLTYINKYQKQTKINTNNNQTLTLEAGKQLNLGTINGKSFNMEISQNGGYQWSGAIPVKATPGSTVSELDRMAAKYSGMYTREEHMKANQVTGVINYLYLITTRGQPTQDFNDFTKQTGVFVTLKVVQ